MQPPPILNKDDILKAEFSYIAETAFQANEDRSRFTSFYFVTVGSFVAAILGTQFELQHKNIALAFFILFAVLTAMGTLTLSQLARLRSSWYESVKAMNVIKDFYIEHNRDIEPAFKWRMNTIPPTDKPYSIANLVAVEVTMLSSLTAATGIYFLLAFLGAVNLISWLGIGVSFAIGWFGQWEWYKRLLGNG